MVEKELWDSDFRLLWREVFVAVVQDLFPRFGPGQPAQPGAGKVDKVFAHGPVTFPPDIEAQHIVVVS